MLTQVFFLLVLICVAIQRILELIKSQRHREILISQGGLEHSSEHYKWMILLHIAWFISMLAEVFFLHRPFYPWIFGVGLAGMLIGNFLRYSSMKTLGERWNTRIIVLPGKPLIQTGFYRYLRHPIYVGICFEIAAIPLLHSAYLTSIIFTFLNALLLRVRIREEEKALP